jgi:cytochrome c oxidase subunit III
VSVVRTRTTPHLPTGTAGIERGRAPGWWGMVFLIFTEATLFAIFITSYFFLRFQHGPVWPPDGIDKPKLFLVSVMTPILLLSSGPVEWAARGIKRGRSRRLKLGIAATMLMGATFLALQGVEYHDILTREFTPRTDAYGSLFFTITGFHGAHVAVGLLLLGWLLVNAVRGRFTQERHLAVEVITLYWHFVDLVWVFIFSSLYLSPHFWP